MGQSNLEPPFPQIPDSMSQTMTTMRRLNESRQDRELYESDTEESVNDSSGVMFGGPSVLGI